MNFLMFFDFTSPDTSHDEAALGDYAVRSVMPELKRLDGVGQLFGSNGQCGSGFIPPASFPII